MLALALRLDKKKSDLALRPALGTKLTAWMKRLETFPYFAETFPLHWEIELCIRFYAGKLAVGASLPSDFPKK